MKTTETIELSCRKEFIKGILDGDFRLLARLLTFIENGEREAVPYLRDLFPYTGRSFSVGITGVPGAGKSTLVDKLAAAYRRHDKKVGIIAIDPSSPFTGGAILGDRIRMQSHCLDTGTYIRSMATRGHTGGLTSSTGDVMTVFDAAGFDVVLIETVGVGQGEVEIAGTADVTIVLLIPGTGDDIQTMKAGIMEIGDIFVINKSDRAGADKVAQQLNSHLSMSSRPDGWVPRVIRTIASDGTGVDECVEAVEAYRLFMADSEFRKKDAVRIQKERLVDLACRRVRDDLLCDETIAARIGELASSVSDKKLDPYTAVEEILKLRAGRLDDDSDEPCD
jgi:LAO/AO transport system kinase